MKTPLDPVKRARESVLSRLIEASKLLCASTYEARQGGEIWRARESTLDCLAELGVVRVRPKAKPVTVTSIPGAAKRITRPVHYDRGAPCGQAYATDGKTSSRAKVTCAACQQTDAFCLPFPHEA